MNNISKTAMLAASIVAGTSAAYASSDYAPAIWNPAYSGHWYTSGNGHKFVVCHDMEGYYASTISYLQGCNNTVSIYYCVNGKQDASSDYPAGEVTQMVREANYAWHVGCWNKYMFGTEHEGFVSNPAWYTDAMYNAGYGSSRSLYEQSGTRLGMTPATYGRGGRGMRIIYTTAACKLGRLLVAATERGVCSVALGDS